MAVTLVVADGLALDLAALGLPDEDALRALVARVVGWDPVDERPDDVSARIDEVPYDIRALTTRGRYRVHGLARRGPERRPFSVFVKVLQSWSLTPEFQFVPEAFREQANAQLPWRVEPLVYASDLATALPPGLRVPVTYAVIDLGPEAAAVWMEDVVFRTAPAWTIEDHAVAARGLGRFAASHRVASALVGLDVEIDGLDLRSYVSGRVEMRLVPMLRSDDVWAHPGVAGHFSALRDRTLALVDGLPALLDELDTLPLGLCHGDACTRNLLRSLDPDGDLTMIDFGFVRHAPLGCDLGQLVLGEIQLGERSSADLESLWSACSEAYVQGLRDEGPEARAEDVRRAAAIVMAIFSGVSAVPLEELDRWDQPDGEMLFAARADVARFLLDLVGGPSPTAVRLPAPSPAPAAVR